MKRLFFDAIPIIFFIFGFIIGGLNQPQSDQYISVGAVKSGEMEVVISSTLEECEKQVLNKNTIHPFGGGNGNFCFAHVMKKSNMRDDFTFEIKFKDWDDVYWFYD